jgi:hypothetical protein
MLLREEFIYSLILFDSIFRRARQFLAATLPKGTNIFPNAPTARTECIITAFAFRQVMPSWKEERKKQEAVYRKYRNAGENRKKGSQPIIYDNDARSV